MHNRVVCVFSPATFSCLGGGGETWISIFSGPQSGLDLVLLKRSKVGQGGQACEQGVAQGWTLGLQLGRSLAASERVGSGMGPAQATVLPGTGGR